MDRLMRVPVVGMVALACAVVPGSAHGDGNTIREVKARADGPRTVVTVRGEATPSFTVYRLEQPPRLVVDLAGARLAAGATEGEGPADGPINVDTWAVSQIAFAQYSSATLRTARVMIGLKRAVTYDVKAQGSDLVVLITPEELPPPGALESARAAEEAQRARVAEEQRRRQAEAERQRAEAEAQGAQKRAELAQAELSRVSAERARAEQALQAARAAESRGAAVAKEVAEREAQLARLRAEQAQAAQRARAEEAEAQRRLAEARSQTADVSRAREVEEQRRKEAAAARSTEEQRRKEAEAARQRAEAEAVAARAARDQAQAELGRLADERARAEKALERARAAENRGAAVEKEIAEREAQLARAKAQQAQAAERATAQEAELSRRLQAVREETDKLARAREEERRQLDRLRAERDQLAAAAAAAREAEAQRAQQASAARTVEEQRRLQAERARQQAEAQAAAAQAERDRAQAELARLADERARSEQALAGLRAARNRSASVEQEIAQREAALARTRAEQAQAQERASAQEAELKARLAAVRAETENLTRARAAEEQRTQQATAARSVEEQRLHEAEGARQRAEAEAARARAARDQAQAELARLAEERARAEKALAAAQAGEAGASGARKTRADAAALASRQAALAQLRADQDEAAKRARAQEAELQARLAAVRAETDKLARARAAEEERREQAEQGRQRAEKEAAAARAARDQAQAELARLVEERARAEKALAAARRSEGAAPRAQDVAAREAALAEARARQQQAEERARAQDAELAARLSAARAETEKLAAARESERRQVEALRAERDRLAAETARLAEERARGQGAADSRPSGARDQQLAAQRARDEAARQARQQEQARAEAAQRQLAQRQQDEQRQPALPKSQPQAEAARLALKAPAPVAAAPAGSGEPRRAAGPPRARVTSVDFRDEERVARVVIGLAGDTDFTQLKAPVALGAGATPTATLRIRSASLPPQLARTLDTSAFGGPVSAISTYADPEDPGAVRVVVKLGANVDPEVRRERGRILWDFPKATLTGSYTPPRMAGFDLNALPLQVGDPNAGASLPAPPGPGRPLGAARKRFGGTPVNLDLKDVDIHNLLRLLSEVGNVNIITSDDVKGTVTIRMKDTPWDQALDVILRQKQLGSVREGNIIRVAPQAVLERERESEVAQTKIIKELLPLETRLVPLSYATADKLLPRVQDLLSPRGKVSVDERTNTLIITDIAGNLALARDLIANLDTQTPQVLIEARIVEAQTNFLRDIGIQWGGSGLTSTQNGYGGTGLNFPSSIGVAGGNVDQLAKTDGLYLNGQQAPVSQSPNYVVNLPAAVGTGAGGALGLTFGSLNGAVNVNLRLSAAESTGNVRILSAPKITTLDNVQAVIEQGTSIPISVVSAAGVNTVFVDAKLNLTVKPHVTHEGSVVMYLEITRNEPDFSRTGARGDPTLLKRQAKTEMLVRDGDTAVIGGIYTRNTSTNYAKLPWLGDIPILGWLFKQRKESDQRSELLIFITPRIVNRAAAMAPR